MLVDIVNSENEPIGALDRSKVLKEGKNFRTVHAWLFTSSNELILQRLVKNHPRSPYRLGSSVAGYLYAGEKHDQAIARKAELEVGSLPRDLQSIGTVAMSDEQYTKFVALYVGWLDHEPHTEDPHIDGFEFLRLAEIDRDVSSNPTRYTATFRAIYRDLRQRIN